jgi:hypothetical protein
LRWGDIDWRGKFKQSRKVFPGDNPGTRTAADLLDKR